MMRRREFITFLGGAATWPLAARAQQPKMLRVGYSGIMPRGAPHYAAFEKRMAELGYQEGRNFTFEYVQAPGIEGYELPYRELARARWTSCSPLATNRHCGRRGRLRAPRRSSSLRSISIQSRRAM
jgi:LPS sulfotransferase NodH